MVAISSQPQYYKNMAMFVIRSTNMTYHHLGRPWGTKLSEFTKYKLFSWRKCIPYCSQNVSHFVWTSMCDIGVPVSIKRWSFQVWIPIIKMVMKPPYLFNRDSYTGKTTSLYEESTLFSKWHSVKPGIALLQWHNNVFSTKAGEWMQFVFRLSYHWIKACHQVLLHWWDRGVLFTWRAPQMWCQEVVNVYGSLACLLWPIFFIKN